MDPLTGISIVFTLISAGIACWQKWKAGKIADAAKSASIGLSTLTTVIELAPSTNPVVQNIKSAMKVISTGLNNEEAINSVVSSGQELMKQLGYKSTEDQLTDKDALDKVIAAIKDN